MAYQPTLSGPWRATAAAAGLLWLASLAAFIVIGFQTSGNTRYGIAVVALMLSGLAVFTFLRNLGRVVSGEIDEPGPWEVRLAAVGLTLLAAAWILLLLP